VADLLAAVGDDTERVDEPRLFADVRRASRTTAVPATSTEGNVTSA
jgi:2-amino-4-hydroxy-6-hydroxymethyldihydropteridine diphosphokinase